MVTGEAISPGRLAAVRVAGHQPAAGHQLGAGHQAGPRLRILGPMQVDGLGGPVHPGPAKQQAVLAALLCSPNAVVTVESLIGMLWDDQPPRTSRKNLQVYVCGLRGLLAAAGSAATVSHRLGGYVLAVEPADLDSLWFEQLARAGLRLWQERHPDAAAVLAQALGLWRGRVLEGMPPTPLASATAQRLEARYLSVFEYWAEAEVSAGGAAGAIDRICAVAQENPLRERLRMVQMIALSQIGRRAEALAVYDELRQALASELGLHPSQALSACYQSLLRDEQAGPPGPQGPWRRTAAGCALPADPPGFTGRSGCVRALTDGLGRAGERLAVLTGPPGAGKTALAVHAARLLAGRFGDGCLFVRMRDRDGSPREPGDVLAQLLRAVWPSGWHRPAGGDQRAVWQDWLADHRCLVVLDDAAGPAQVRAVLPDAGGSAVLVTARPMLAGLGPALRIAVPALSQPDAVRLLGQVIGHDRVAADLRSAERIVQAAGLLPLGVRALGGKLAVLRHVPLREFLARLASPGALLDELTSGDVTVRDHLDRALADLPGWAETACLLLAGLPDRFFTLDEAAAALGVEPDRAMGMLEAMLERGAVGAPDAETVAHTVIYELPPLLALHARVSGPRPPAAPAA